MSQFFFPFNKRISQGDDRVIKLIFDCTVHDWEFYYTAKRNNSDSDDDAVIKVNPSEVIMSESSVDYTNIVEIPLASAKTNIEPNKYKQDIKVIKPGSVKNTIAEGVLTIASHTTDRDTE